LASNNLEYAIRYAEDYMTAVIRPESERKKVEGVTFSSVKAVEAQLGKLNRSGSKGVSSKGPVTIPFQVLATILQKSNKRKANAADTASINNNNKKYNNNKDGDDSKDVITIAKVPGKVAGKGKKLPCFAFATSDGCKFGDRCRFSHTA
jgi:hypothetical protein